MPWRDLGWWTIVSVVIVGAYLVLSLVGCGDPFVEFPGTSSGTGVGGDGAGGSGAGPTTSVGGGVGGAVEPSCDDGLQNGDEVGLDCGGVCAACPPDGCLYPHQHAGCDPVYLSDYCPTAERNVHGCVQLNAVSWAASIVVDTVTYDKAVNMHAPPFGGADDIACAYYDADVVYEEGRGTTHWLLGGEYGSYEAMIGLSQTGPNAPEGSMIFAVRADGVEIYVSPVLAGYDTADVALDVTDVDDLELVVDSAGGDYVGDRGAWVEAQLVPGCSP